MNEAVLTKKGKGTSGDSTRNWAQLTDYDHTGAQGMEENLSDFFLKRNGLERAGAASVITQKQ